MKSVFVDSGAFFAHLVSEDPLHARAMEFFTRAAEQGWRLVTTNAVVYETHALVTNRAREGRDAGVRFLDAIESGICELVRVTPEDDARAEAILRGHDDKAYSFCDALSFVVMERLGVTEAIAFDRHFREYGQFTIL